MKQVLKPLAQVPGLRQALVIGQDGLLIHSLAGAAGGIGPVQHDVICALVLGWVRDLETSFGPLSWEAPERLVLQGSKATLVVCRGPQVFLAVWLEPGTLADDLRVPMQAALGRIARLLRGLGEGMSALESSSDSETFPEPIAPLPTEFAARGTSQEHDSVRPTLGLAGNKPRKEGA